MVADRSSTEETRIPQVLLMCFYGVLGKKHYLMLRTELIILILPFFLSQTHLNHQPNILFFSHTLPLTMKLPLEQRVLVVAVSFCYGVCFFERIQIPLASNL
ncbi:hypothetical protein V8G54_024210 [Vigna mungo]|uniref:Uncharacterized protein n=1 Tax=Vigna mungo TaxID=3915 RepID=A0AAQ3N5J3_VIGMU